MMKKQLRPLTFCISPKMLASKAISIFTLKQNDGLIFSWLLNKIGRMKNKVVGVINILIGGYIGWVAYDCYQQETLASNQVKSMAVIAIWIVLSGVYYLLKDK